MKSIVLEQSERTRIHRLPQRGSYDQETIHAILDEALICHVGFIVEGRPVVIPTIHARIDNQLYFHGSPAAGMLRTLREGVDACVTVTILDGLVLARSAFHHSMNYRSVVILGRAEAVQEPEEKLEAMRIFVEHMMPGRWTDIRRPTPKELQATSVLSISLDEASAKVRSGGPLDDQDDLSLSVWAGEVPLHLQASAPVVDQETLPGLEAPEYAVS